MGIAKRITTWALCFVLAAGLLSTMSLTAFAASGEGTESDPYCVTTLAELKGALEGSEYEFIKISASTNIDEVYEAAAYDPVIKINGSKTLVVDGSLTVWASYGGAAVESLFYVDEGDVFNIKGSGCVTFKSNANSASNSVLHLEKGFAFVTGTTLNGSRNNGSYGVAVTNRGGMLYLYGGSYTGEVAYVTKNAAVSLQGGTTYIQDGAALSGSVVSGASVEEDSRSRVSTLYIGDDANVNLGKCTIDAFDDNSGKSVRCYSVVLPNGEKLAPGYLMSDKYEVLVKGTTTPVADSDYGNVGSATDFGLSKDIAVSKKVEELTFVDSDSFDVPAGEVSTGIAAIDVSGGVAGGTEPYKFTFATGPDWLQISDAGVITGTRPDAAQDPATAYVQVEDAAGKKNGAWIQVGAVTEAPEELGFVNNGFNVPAGEVGTAITAIDVSSGVTGGTEPYTFSMYYDNSTEKWLQVSEDGKITGTRPATAQNASSAYIQVEDANGKTNTVLIQIGAVTEASEETVTLTNVADITIAGSEVKTVMNK